MFTLTIKKNEEKKINFYHFTSESGEEIVKKAMDCAQVFIRKTGIENIKFDLSDSRQVTLYNKMAATKVEVSEKKDSEAKTSKTEVESVEVKVTSEGSEVKEGKAVVNGHVQTERTYVTDNGDVITIVA